MSLLRSTIYIYGSLFWSFTPLGLQTINNLSYVTYNALTKLVPVLGLDLQS